MTTMTPTERVDELLDAMLTTPENDAHERRLNALANALTDRELLYDSTRGQRFVESTAAEWIMSKASQVALTLVDAGSLVYDLFLQGNENEQRERMTFDRSLAFGVAMCDAVYMYVNEQQDRLGYSWDARQRLPAPQPSYTQLRNYIAFDLGARYVIACAVAFRLTPSPFRRKGSAFFEGPDLGWL